MIDLNTGDLVHATTVGGIVEELYDVLVLPGVRRPMALGSRQMKSVVSSASRKRPEATGHGLVIVTYLCLNAGQD